MLVIALVPLLSSLAKKIGLVDRPDKRRKLHSREIPLIGGVAILLAVLIGCLLVSVLCVVGIFPKPIVASITTTEIFQLTGLTIGALLIVGVGVMDDRFGVRGRQKLFAQLIVAVILVASGTWIQSIEFFDTKLRFGDAFTYKPQSRFTELEKDLNEFQLVEEDRIRRQEADQILDQNKADAQVAELESSVSSLKKNSYIREFFFNRLLAFGAMVITVIWIVGAINSVNLIDGADGLAGTTTFIVSLALAIIAFWCNHFIEGAIALSLAGAILGFLVFNFPPAKIFLGDAGSMLIGMVLASLAVQSYLKEPMIYICLAPLAMLFIPIFDSATAFARRLTTGRSIYSTDRGHLHHLLLRHGLSNKGMVFFVGGLTLITAGGAVLTVVMNDPTFSIIGVATVIVFLVSAKVFGFAEFKLLCTRVLRLARSLVLPIKARKTVQSISVQLQGSKEWDKLWQAIIEFAEKHSFKQIKLDLNLPWLHESFHADWKQPIVAENEEMWQTRLPLAANGRVYGRIEISGAAKNESIYLVLMLMSDLLETMEPAIAKLADGKEDTVEIPVIESRRTQRGENGELSDSSKLSDSDSRETVGS